MGIAIYPKGDKIKAKISKHKLLPLDSWFLEASIQVPSYYMFFYFWIWIYGWNAHFSRFGFKPSARITNKPFFTLENK